LNDKYVSIDKKMSMDEF